MPNEPKFTPKPGQTDYTNIRYAPVINTVVANDGKVLLVRRNPTMRLYPGHWNGISGFLDDSSSVEDKALGELSEELGLASSDIKSLERGQVLVQEAPEYGKTWIVFPVFVRVEATNFKLDWEAQEARWFSLGEARNLKLVPGFGEVLAQFSKMI